MSKSEFESKDAYWATKPAGELVRHLCERRKKFEDMLQGSAFLSRIDRSWSYYHGRYNAESSSNGMAIQDTGDDGEIALANINHTRSLINQMVTYVMQQRPAWDSRALNKDFQTRQQTILSNDLLDAYMELRGAEEKIRKATLYAAVMASGFMYVRWDPAAGHGIRPDESGRMMYEGDLTFNAKCITDIFWDFTQPDWDENVWIDTRSFVNRWDLIAQMPEHEEKIREAPQVGANDSRYESDKTILASDLTDLIELREFWHRCTPALTDGRHLAYIANEHPLTPDENQIEPNEFKCLPVARLVPDEFLLNCMGYSSSFDMQVPQELFGAALSTLITNLNILGQPKVWTHEDDNITPEELEPGSGITQLKSRVKPEAIEFFTNEQLQPISTCLSIATQQAEYMSGVGPASRGQLEGEQKGASGAHLALLDSKSILQSTTFRQRHDAFRSQIGTIAIKILQKKATTQRVMALAGRANQGKLLKWSAEDIASVESVAVDSGNPLQRSIAGRIQLADALAERAWLSTPQEYLTVIQTGRLEPMIDSMESQLAVIADENQRVLENAGQVEQLLPQLERAIQMKTQAMGGMDMIMAEQAAAEIKKILQVLGLVALKTDNHILHIRRNTSILDTTEVRMKPGIVLPITAHVQIHLEMLADPEVQKQQLLLGYVTGQQLQEFMTSMSIAVPIPGVPHGGGHAPGAGNPAQVVGKKDEAGGNPRPMSETGRKPEAPRVTGQLIAKNAGM